MALDKSKLSKEQRMDVRGNLVSRWVKTAPSEPSAAAKTLGKVAPRIDFRGRPVQKHVRIDPSEVSGAGKQEATERAGASVDSRVPTNINWDKSTPERARAVLDMVSLGLDNPDKLWSNFDFYTGALESKHSDIALDSIKEHGVFKELEWAWNRKWGVNPEISKNYQQIDGDEGYESFKSSYDDLLAATERARGRK